MKYFGLLSGILAVTLFVACSNPTPITPKNRDLIGDFEDTLWSGNTAYVYNLKLKEDSSFFLNVRTLGSGVPMTYLGNYKPTTDWNGLQLNGADSTHRFTVTIASNDLLKLKTDQGEAQLDRTTKLLETKNGVLIKERFKPNNKNRAVVYQRSDDGEVTVQKTYINQATPEVKALISYYAFRYNTVCSQGNCVLPQALGADVGQLKSTIQLYFPLDTADAKWFEAPIPFDQKPELSLLYITAAGNAYQVQSVTTSSKGNLVAFSDVWEIQNYKWKQTLHTSGPTDMAVLLDRDVQVNKPSGDQMIINIKK